MDILYSLPDTMTYMFRFAGGVRRAMDRKTEMMRILKRFTAGLQVFLLLGGSVYAQPTKFVILGSGSQTAGTTQNLTIRADSSGSPAASGRPMSSSSR